MEMSKDIKPRKSKEVPVTQGMFTEFRAEMMSRFSSMDKTQAEVHRVGLIVEEQNARNKFVLDGYTNLHDRVAKLEGI